MGKVISVMSVKGGVGKTTTTVNLGFALASLGKKVLLLDANLSAPNLGLHLGIVDPDRTIHDVLNRKVNIEEVIYPHSKNLDVMPGYIATKRIKVSSVDFRRLVNLVRDKYDVVLLDTSPALSEDIPGILFASDNILIVTTPDYPTLNCTIQTVQAAKDEGKDILGIVLNKVDKGSYELSLEDVEKATQLPVVALINDHKNFKKSVAETIPIVEHSPDKSYSKEYMKLAAAIVGEDYKDTGIFA